MTKSILINKVIYKLLSSNTTLQEKVGTNIFPLVADNDTTFPFIVFYRSGISNGIMKDGFTNDSVNYTVMVVSDKYFTGAEIAQAVRETLEFKKYEDEDMKILCSQLTDISETYFEDSYV